MQYGRNPVGSILRSTGTTVTEVTVLVAALLHAVGPVPLHFSLPLPAEVLFGGNITIKWRYDFRYAERCQALNSVRRLLPPPARTLQGA